MDKNLPISAPRAVTPGSYEQCWMNRVEITREWIEYKDDAKYPSLIQPQDGYVREARRGINWDAVDDTYHWPLMDKDKYEHFYRDHYSEKPHSNFVSTEDFDGSMGPIIFSCEAKNQHTPQRELKVLVQSKKGVERVTIPLRAQEEMGTIPAVKQALPHYNSMRFQKINGQQIKDRLFKYEDQLVRTVYKFGILYCKEGQTSEDEMYNNQTGSPALEEFLDFLGDRVQLEGFTGYRGGLDVKTNTTGTHSVYTRYIDDCEIMFHVSTLLQFYPADPQQVERKRHLGNDVIMIIFREGRNTPFDMKGIRSQFNHVFFVIEVDKALSVNGETYYRVEVGCKEGVHPFSPDLPNPPVIRKCPKSKNWFLSKLINSERAAYYAPDFIMKFRMTRKQQLQAVIEEALSSGSGKRSLSLGRKTGSQILKKSASKMRDIMDRSSSSAQEVDISEPSNFRHEGHLDNFSMATFGSVPIMELLKDDIAAGILPAAAFAKGGSAGGQQPYKGEQQYAPPPQPPSALPAPPEPKSPTTNRKAIVRKSVRPTPNKPVPPSPPPSRPHAGSFDSDDSDYQPSPRLVNSSPAVPIIDDYNDNSAARGRSHSGGTDSASSPSSSKLKVGSNGLPKRTPPKRPTPPPDRAPGGATIRFTGSADSASPRGRHSPSAPDPLETQPYHQPQSQSPQPPQQPLVPPERPTKPPPPRPGGAGAVPVRRRPTTPQGGESVPSGSPRGNNNGASPNGSNGINKMSPGISKSHPALPTEETLNDMCAEFSLPQSLVQQLKEEEQDASSMSRAAKRGTKKLPPTPPGMPSKEQRRRTIGATAGKAKLRPTLEGNTFRPLPSGPEST